MFALADLPRPIIAAPMAGGPSTPALVHAVAQAGGMGFLAGGYKSTAQVVEEIHAVRSSGTDIFGVNLFVPEPDEPNLGEALAYRDLLLPLADEYGAELPQPRHDDDGWDAKLEALLDLAVPVVSFTFGCPTTDALARFRREGIATLVSVTSADEAMLAAERGATAVVLQGPEAGGHRATFDVQQEAPVETLKDAFDAARAAVDVPIVVAGGISTPEQVAEWLARAEAVQLGTAFLDADEAGTKPAHRAALRDPRFDQTALTRAFSGRIARGLRNDFIDRFDEASPSAYPAVNHLTAPIRATASQAGNAEHMSLWAGTGWRNARPESAAQIMQALLP